MKSKLYNQSLLKIAGVWGIGGIFILFTWLFLLNQVKVHQNTIVEVFANNQWTETVKLAEQLENRNEDLSAAKSHTQASANQEVFIYTKDEMLSLLDKWQYGGGQNITRIKDSISNGVSGTDKVTRGNQREEEIVSWSFVRLEDKDYVVGKATLLTYVLTITGILEHATRLYMLGVILTLGILCFCLLFSLYLSKTVKKLNNFQEEVKNKNRQIDAFQKELEMMRQITKHARVYDLDTGVYNADFFNYLIQRLNMEDLLPVTIIRAEASVADSTGENQKHENIKENIPTKCMLKKAAAFLAEKINTSGIVACLENNEFGIVSFEPEEYAQERLDAMKDEIRFKLGEELSINFCIITREKVMERNSA